MKLSTFVVALMALFLIGCGAADMGEPVPVDCERLDGNGNCLPEGATGIPDH